MHVIAALKSPALKSRISWQPIAGAFHPSIRLLRRPGQARPKSKKRWPPCCQNRQADTYRVDSKMCQSRLLASAGCESKLVSRLGVWGTSNFDATMCWRSMSSCHRHHTRHFIYSKEILCAQIVPHIWTYGTDSQIRRTGRQSADERYY
jgi:hypothetical protein